MTDNDDEAALARRIGEAVRRAGGARVVGERAGLSGSTIGNWTSGQTVPKAGDLLRLARAANCSIAWLMTGVGPQTGSAQSYRDAVRGSAAEPGLREPGADYDHGGEFVPVRRHDIAVSAGDGLTAIEPSVDLSPLAFRVDWLRKTVSALDQAALVSVRGNSMAPLIQDGDLLLIDRGAAYPAAGGIFVLRIGDEVVVKRVAPSGKPDKLRISSENAELYPAFDVPAEEVHIVGRVRWVGRGL